MVTTLQNSTSSSHTLSQQPRNNDKSCEKKDSGKSSNVFVHIDDAHQDMPPTELLKERKVLFRSSLTQFDIESINIANG